MPAVGRLWPSDDYDDVPIRPTYPILHYMILEVLMMILSLSKRFIPHPPSHDIGNSFIPSSDLHELPWKFHLHLYCVLKRALFREIWPFCTEPCELHTSLFSLLYPLYTVMPKRAYGAKKWKQISKFTEQIAYISPISRHCSHPDILTTFSFCRNEQGRSEMTPLRCN